MFQGKYEERSKRGERRNFSRVDSTAHGLTDILITHPHIDHTGLVPRVYKNGITPRLLATDTSAVFMGELLYNSAQIQEKENPQNQLYTSADVDRALRHLRKVEPFTQIPIGQKHGKNTATFLPNGHVEGSNSVIVHLDKTDQNILFTGDMGKPVQSLCGGYLDHVDRYPSVRIHTAVIESTGFDSTPTTFNEKRTRLINAITKTCEFGGVPLIPSLSFHRLQELMEMLNNSRGTLLPADCQIIIDAPFGVSLLESYQNLDSRELSRRYGDDPDYYQTEEASRARFDKKNFTIIGSHEDSIQYANQPHYNGKKVIIIASGGMGEHGRVVNYLHGAFNRNPLNSILFTCHQVDGTHGAALVKKEKLSSKKPTSAHVEKIEGFTSHVSGPDQAFQFLERFNLDHLETIIITHGNDSARNGMDQEFDKRGYKAKRYLPSLNQAIDI